MLYHVQMKLPAFGGRQLMLLHSISVTDVTDVSPLASGVHLEILEVAVLW